MNTKVASVLVRKISDDQHQTVLSFQGDLECNENELEKIYETIAGKLLKKSYSIKVTEESQLLVLINNDIDSTNLNYIEKLITELNFLAIKLELFVNPQKSIQSFLIDKLQEFHEIIVSKILRENDVISVIIEDQLYDKYPSYLKEIAPKPKSFVKHPDTLILKLPLHVDQLQTVSNLFRLIYQLNKLETFKKLPSDFKVLSERDLNVLKLDQSWNFTSDTDEDTELRYIKKDKVIPFVPKKSHVKHHILQVNDFSLSKYPQQTNLYYRSNSVIKLSKIHKTIVGKILSERDVIVVTKDDQLFDLLSDAVEDTDLSYIKRIAVEIKSFVPEPKSNVVHHATLVKNFPLSAAEDLASSSEFTFGNLWFLIPSDYTNIDQWENDVISDIRKLSTFVFNKLPLLKNEAVASPAMYDGLEILWFKPDHDAYFKKVFGSSITFLNVT